MWRIKRFIEGKMKLVTDVSKSRTLANFRRISHSRVHTTYLRYCCIVIRSYVLVS